MVTCSGKSLVPIDIAVFQSFMDSVVPPAKLPSFEIKLDARAKVKSVFAKLEKTTLTIYTGAIVQCGLQKFFEIERPESLLMLFTIFGIKKAGSGLEFEIKSTDQDVSAVKCDDDFKLLSGKLGQFMAKYDQLVEQARFKALVANSIQSTQNAMPASAVLPVQTQSVQTQPVQESVVSAPKPVPKVSTKDSPFKGQPLTDTPKIDVPDDLDLRNV